MIIVGLMCVILGLLIWMRHIDFWRREYKARWEYDHRKAGWIPTAVYDSKKLVSEHEIGSIDAGCRYIETGDHPIVFRRVDYL